MFSIFLDSGNKANSKIVYGGLPKEFLHKQMQIIYFDNYEKPELEYENAYWSDFWMLEADQVLFDDQVIESNVDKIILDTGCTLH